MFLVLKTLPGRISYSFVQRASGRLLRINEERRIAKAPRSRWAANCFHTCHTPRITNWLPHARDPIPFFFNYIVQYCTYTIVRLSVPAGTYVKLTYPQLQQLS